MQSIAAKLAGLLQKVERPGDFYAAGTAAIFPPQLEVDGVGVIALPLLDVQAEQLIAAAERAPYGRGIETVHDERSGALGKSMPAAFVSPAVIGRKVSTGLLPKPRRASA